jgi:hypothetical protein
VRTPLLLALALGLLMMLMGENARAERPVFTLDVSPSEIVLGESVAVTVTIEMAGLVGPDRYWQPQAKEFRLLDSQIKRGTQTTLDPVEGQKLKTVEVYRYILEPTTTGRLAIGPAKIRVQGDEWETRERFVRVRVSKTGPTEVVGIGHTDASTLGAPGYEPPQGPREDVFLYAVCDKKSAWVGEQFTVSWLLFTRAEVLRYEPTPPRLSQLWSETLFEPKSFFKYSDARLGTKDYVVALVSKRAFFASEPGPLRIDALEAKIATVATAMGRSESIASNELSIRINALPTPAPQGFDASYVGEFKIGASVDRSLLQAGDALTLTVRVEAEGAIRRTRAPRLAFPGFRFEEPRDFSEVDTTTGDVVSGRREYRYWTTPSVGGEQSIPAITLSYFSPTLGQYRVAKTAAIGITVQGDPEALAAESLRKRTATLDRDIRLLRTTESVHTRVLADFYQQSWFWYLLLAPPLLFLCMVVGLRLQARLQTDTPRSRMRRARGKVREHFKIAEIHLRGKRSAKFYGELSLAIHGHLEEWLRRGTRSMTREQLREFLVLQGAEKGTVRKLLARLDAFDRERFAPSDVDEDAMNNAKDAASSLLTAIEKQTRAAMVEHGGES